MDSTRIKIICAAGFFLLMFSATSGAQELASTPPMGWNSWNYFGKKDINERIIREVIDAIDSNGMKEAGYQYVIIDGGWRGKSLHRDGRLKWNRKRFPNGIKALADYAHSKGLKLGLHTAAGTEDCGGDKVGGYGHEEVQIKQFKEWGIDFIKLDRCRLNNGWKWSEKETKEVYFKWKRLLEKIDKKILLSISAYKFRNWNPLVGEMSRTTGDISARSNGGAYFDTLYGSKRHFNSVMENAEINNKSKDYAGDGYWNFPDMLPLGHQDGLSISEQKSAFALWCIMSSPLILGNDPRHLSDEEKEIILNKLAIEINQDPKEQGRRVYKDGYSEIWVKHLMNGNVACLLLNRSPYDSKRICLKFQELGFLRPAEIIDVYSSKKLGVFYRLFDHLIPPRSSLFLLIKKRENIDDF